MGGRQGLRYARRHLDEPLSNGSAPGTCHGRRSFASSCSSGLAKFGAAYGVRTGVHVGVDVAINQLEPGSRRKVVLFGLACGRFSPSSSVRLDFGFVLHMYETGQSSNDLEAPMWIVYLAIPLGSYLMCFRFLQVALAFYRTGELPHTDESHVEGIEPIPGDVMAEAGLKPRSAPVAGGVR